MPTDHAFLETIDLFAELDPQTRKKSPAISLCRHPLKQVSGSPCGLNSETLRRDAFFSQSPPGGPFFRDFMT
jgi:hypothetical protein